MLPPISNLLQYQIGEDINIEQGLCTPNNENVFLLSSIAFLQKQLVRKLANDSKSKQDDDMNRRYSDLLLVESGQKSKRQKCFIRPPNMEKFDEMLKSEASLPDKTLSNTQILPLPKKNKGAKLSITNIFKQKSNTDMENFLHKKSSSLFNIFRKNSNSAKSSESNISSCENSMVHIDPEKYILIEEDEYTRRSMCSLSSISSLKENIHQSALKDGVQSHNDDISKYHLNSYRQKELSDIEEDEYTRRSMCSLSSISSLKENIHQSALKDGVQSHNDDISKYHLNSYRQKELSDIEEEILKVIPTETNLQIKRSINEKLRVSKKLSQSSLNSLKNFSDVSFVRNEDDFLEDPQTGIKFKCVPQSNGRRIREQQSKLSERSHPFHGSAKNSKVSPETMEVVMNELMCQLEKRN
ncbi:hypothetical protein QE152_g7438 [Popillia japonica]|uniref:Uncharacterized protein n=1 Tax=Popillia japonica TaxID=7064 RepID=A0AAW1ME69_POPJA